MDDAIVEEDIGTHDLRGGTVAALNENSGRVSDKVEVLACSADGLTIVADLRGVDGGAVDELNKKDKGSEGPSTKK